MLWFPLLAILPLESCLNRVDDVSGICSLHGLSRVFPIVWDILWAQWGLNESGDGGRARVQ